MRHFAAMTDIYPDTIMDVFAKTQKSTFLIASIMALVGCGGEDNSTENASLPLVTDNSKLNDTGVTACWDNLSVIGACHTASLGLWFDLNQDGQSGRDALAAKGLLRKTGAGSAGFDFTKIGVNGAELPASATSWNCVLDNHTGLMWEVKTTDGGLHDMDDTYLWYDPTVGYLEGYENGGINTHTFVAAVNAAGLCGHHDWRLPDEVELLGLVDFSKVIPAPAIDEGYFPNTKTDSYWTSQTVSRNGGEAHAVDFQNGFTYGAHYKNAGYYVRVVRSNGI